MPSPEQMKGKKYCKYHNVFGHTTNTCMCFGDATQKAIEEGRLIFEEKKKDPIKLDIDPFQVAVSFSEPENLDICMVKFKQMEDFSAVHEVQNNFGRFETCGFDAKEANNVNPINMVTA